MKKILIFSLILGLLVIGFYVYFHEIGRMRTSSNEIFITSAEIPGAFDGARIVQISDLMIRDDRSLTLLENVVSSVNDLEPEIIFFTGNLFLGSGLQFQREVTELLSELNEELIKIAVLGYDDLAHESQTMSVLNAAGFQVLTNNSRQIFNQSPIGINVIGAHPQNDRATMEELLAGHSMTNRVNIVLASVPTFATTAFDFPILAQFSGHCLATQDTSNREAACFQFYLGTYQFADRFTLHVSAGVARFQTPQNLMRRPSIDSFLLRSESDDVQ